MGHTVVIEQVPPIQWKRKDCVAFFDPGAMRIVIRRGRKSVVEQAYYHELMHAVFYCLGFDDLYGDEQKVDSIAGLLHQAATTQKHPRQARRTRKG
jgi:hypothetical protein